MHPWLSALQRSAHVGENRCWPCTAANLVILAAGALALSLRAPAAGAALAVVGAAAIWLRGYLIPFTPQFAPRLAARLPRDPFHTDVGPADAERADGSRPPAAADGPSSIEDADRTADDEPVDPEADEGEAVLSSLVAAGVVDTDGGDVAIDAEFEDRWYEEMAALREAPPDALADATLDVAPGAVDVDVVTPGGRTYVVLSDGSDDVAGETWLRRPVAIAETAAARTLADFGVPAEQRAAGAAALCLFLETCPTCDGAVDERLAGGCCGPPQRGRDGSVLQALVCETCSVQFATYE